MESLLSQIKNCRACERHLEHGVNPIVSVNSNSKILIIGHAPGRLVHNTSIPWNDKSGDNLRSWLGVDKEQFYNPDNFGLMPMGFCYPGKGKTGDLAPRVECAPLWHDKIFESLTDIRLILLIGQYAQRYYLKDKANSSLTETVRDYKKFLPKYFPLPHPSPRNNIWRRKNIWFELEVLPELRDAVKNII